MARNKYPEQTVEQILTIAERLFAERGYEKTTMQDIIDELKMSKGAIYHHFKSKEDIIQTVINNKVASEKELLNKLVDEALQSNAKDKLSTLMLSYFNGMANIYTKDIGTQLGAQMQNPRFLMESMQGAVTEIAPVVVKLIPENATTSVTGEDFSLEYAELILLILTIYSKPVVFGWSAEETKKHWRALQQVTKTLGLDLISDDLLDKFGDIVKILTTQQDET